MDSETGKEESKDVKGIGDVILVGLKVVLGKRVREWGTWKWEFGSDKVTCNERSRTSRGVGCGRMEDKMMGGEEVEEPPFLLICLFRCSLCPSSCSPFRFSHSKSLLFFFERSNLNLHPPWKCSTNILLTCHGPHWSPVMISAFPSFTTPLINIPVLYFP